MTLNCIKTLKMEVIMQILNTILTTTLFLGYLVLWQVKRKEVQKQAGIDVNVLSNNTRPIQRYFAKLEKIMTILVILLITLHFFFANHFIVTQYFWSTTFAPTQIIGFITGITGLVICRIAQVTMGKSWRVGIDEKISPGLITHGIYQYMRNPTYTGLYMLSTGVWLINPTALFSCWIIAFFLMMEFQVRCEEEYLEELYGQNFKKYCKKTKRYMPFVY